jgi:hypothetical protein
MYLALGQSSPSQIDTSGAIVSAPDIQSITVTGQRPINWMMIIALATLGLLIFQTLRKGR